MSTAKRLVLSLRGRKDSSHNGSAAAGSAGTTTSSTRLVSAGAGISGSSPGHELDEIAVVSGSGLIGCNSSGVGIGSGIGIVDTGRHASYGSLLAASGQLNGPRFVPEIDDNWTRYQNINVDGSDRATTCTISTNFYNLKKKNQLKTIIHKNNHQKGVVGVSSGGCGGIINGGYCTNDNIALHLIDYGGSIGGPLPSSAAGQMVGDGEGYWRDSDVDMLLLRRQSVADIVSSKFGLSARSHLGQSISQQGFFSTSRDSLSVPCISAATPTPPAGTGHTEHMTHVSVTASEMDLSRKGRGGNSSSGCATTGGGGKKDTHTTGQVNIVGGGRTKSGEQPLLGSWSRSGTSGFGGPGGGGTGPGGCGGGPRGSMVNTVPIAAASSNHLNGCNGTERTGRRSGSSSRGGRRSSSGITISPGGAKWTFVFDPAGRLCYYWSMVVSLAFLYNFWVIIYRFAFQEINGETIVVWFCLDYFSDFLYLVDILFHFRTGYLEDGVLQTDSTKLRQHYMNSTTFYIDCLCLLPLDFLYLSIGFNSILRSFRLVKIYRFWAFMDRTERHTNYPNLFRSTSLIHYLLVIFHWNGCLYHIIYKNNGFGSKNWVFHDSESADVVKQYLQSYYWCTLALTTIGDLPRPRSKAEYVFVIAQLLFGLMLFATVLGHVANIVTSVSAARKEFQAKLDGVKTYMRMRRVPNHLQIKVIKWFDYLWLTQKCSDEERAVSCLPDKLKAEIAINVHLDTLKRVEIFQNTEAGFLCELVLRLRPVLFSPGDYICRKGEVGKEMYIVNRGRLQVVADNGKTVMASLKAGSYFGEISILNMGTAGNRRTASVRSVGYSDLFVLSKKDMWDVLKEYPAARVRLEAIAVKRLEKYKKAPLEKVAMGRCQSTPGLVETKGRTPLEEMWISTGGTGCGTVAIPEGQSIPYGQSILYGQSISYGQCISQALSPHCNRVDTTSRVSESPGSMSPSANSSEPERPRSRTTSYHSRPQSQPTARVSSGPICDSLTHLESSGATPLLGSHEVLEDEVKRLRERLHTVEAENIALNSKLAQQQYELEHRLAEIEMQICGASSASSIDQELHEQEEIERNRESII